MLRSLIGSLTAVLLAASLAYAEPPAKVKLDPFGDPIETTDDSLTLDPARERGLVKQLYAAADDPKAALEAMTQLPSPPTELELRALRNLDRELSESDHPLHQQLVNKAVPALATSGDPTSLQYLHKVFDSHPERRAAIADGIARFALAKQRRPHDWSLLVRSLTSVHGDEAVRVLQALQKYRQRGTSPVVERNVLLVGLELGDERAAEALKLLEYWTGEQPVAENAPIRDQLIAWQKWYHETYPALPEATLPVDAPSSTHTFKELLAYLRSREGRGGDVARGAVMFEKALCIKCHRFGERGERIGPDLTKVSQRLSDEELVQSLLFPSHQISDQYATKQIELKDGRVLSGIVGEQGDSLVVLPADAMKRVVPKSEIAEMHDSPLSAMPSDLVNKLTRDEIADLFAYLRKVPE